MTDAGERLETLDKHIAVLRQEQQQIRTELGLGETKDLTQQIKSEDETSTAFDQLTPAERLNLYNTDRETWDQFLAAKEAHGTRRLLHGI